VGRQAIALQNHRLGVKHRAKPCGRRSADALGHGQQQYAAVALRQQPFQSHRAPRLQRSAQVQAAEQGGVAGVEWYAAQRCACGQQGAQQRQPVITQAARRRAQGHTAQAYRVYGKQGGNRGCVTLHGVDGCL